MNAIFKENYTLELFITIKMAYSCCFSLRGILYFQDFLQKNVFNINYRSEFPILSFKMSDVNGLSDNEKDTDTESLPEVVHSKPVKNCNDKNVWKLHQNVSGLCMDILLRQR